MTASSTSHKVELRYGNPDGLAKLSINQDISAGKHRSIAHRRLSMEFQLNEAPDAFAVGISKIRASYTAHDMTQRLPASGLKGQSFALEKIEDSRALQRTESDDKLQVGLGPMIGADYPVGLALADILPILPEQPVTVGSTWESSRATRSLEGWAWTEANLDSEHLVTDIDQRDGHTIVTVKSTASAKLSDVEGGVIFSGDGELTRTSSWRFDATDGHLLSVSMEQRTSGVNTLPQGDIDVRQRTKVKYSTE
jgi:hypothetical protein